MRTVSLNEDRLTELMKCWLKKQHLCTQLTLSFKENCVQIWRLHYINFLKAPLNWGNCRLASHCHKIDDVSPTVEETGVGDMFFFAYPVGIWCLRWRSLSVLYLVNRWVDYNQTQMDTSLGFGRQMIDFGDHDPIFKGHHLTKCLSAPLSQEFRSNLVDCIIWMTWLKFDTSLGWG